MSRVIKFRVWRNAFSIGPEPIAAGWLPDRVLGSDGQVYLDDYGLCSEHYVEQYGGKLHVEQFTGLLDKNGREIYEGDIVEMAEEFGDCIPEDIDMSDPRIIQFPTDARAGYILRGLHIGQVKFDEGAFRLFGRTIISRLTCVLGNIHENPDLLKP